VDGIGKEHQSQLNIGRLEGMDWRNRKMEVRQIEPIDRAELRATIQKWIDAHTDVDDTDGVGLLEDVLWEINAQPTLTPPEIVYCQDCVHLEDGYAHWCNKWEHICPDDSEFFCKFGRKKDENTTD
jgi:hypothetical protein